MGMTETRNLMVILTEDEIKDYSKKLAEETQAVNSLENEKKSVTAEYGSKITRHKTNINDLARKITTREEMREIRCRWVYHWQDGVKVLIRTDNGKQIDKQEIKDYERQAELPVVDDDEELEKVEETKDDDADVDESKLAENLAKAREHEREPKEIF